MKIVKLGDVCSIINGGTPKTGIAEYWDGDILWITPRDLGKVTERETNRTDRKITQSGIDNSSAKVVPIQSVILSTRAPIGHVVINAEPMAFNQGCRGLVPGDTILAEYLYYFLKLSKEKLNELGTGTTFRELSAGALKNVEIPLLSLEEQRRVVERLDAAFEKIDRAIELTEKNINNSEDLFKLELEKPDRAAPKSLGDFVTIRTGKLNANAANLSGQYPFFTCSRQVFSIDSFSFDCEAILLAGNNASGDFNVKYYKGKFDAYQRTYVITIDDESKLLYKQLYYELVRALGRLKGKSVGAGTKFLKLNMIKELAISAPNIEVQKVRVEKLERLQRHSDELSIRYTRKLEYLTALRQSLLTQAFSQSEVE